MANNSKKQDLKDLEVLIKDTDERQSRALQEFREETQKSLDEIKKMIQGLISSRHEVNVPSHHAAVNRNDGILESGDSSMVHASNEFSMRVNCYAKIEFPRFDGSCITEWFYKADQFFEIDHTNEWNKEKIASLHLDGKALHWYKAFLEMKEKDKIVSWKEFVTAATDRFGELLILDPVAELKNLEQKESLQQHLEEFNCAKLEPMVVLKGGIYTMYQEQETLKFLQPSLMKLVDVPQFFEEILQWEFVPWNAKIGTEFEKQLNDVTYSSDGNFSSNDQQQWAVIVAAYLKLVTKLFDLEILAWKVYDGGGFQNLEGCWFICGALLNCRFFNTHLPSDLVVEIWEASFHLHKFPPLSKCGKVAHTLEKSKNTRVEVHLTLDGCPGGLDTFINAAKICYGFKVELSPTSILVVYCVAEFLGMTDEFGEEKLLAQAEAYFHKVVLRNWKDCIVALQSADNSILQAESLHNALSIMVCIDPSLFGWPMMMYRSLQSPGGNIIWNGINTGARIRSSISDWSFEDAVLAFLRMEKSEVELNKATLVTTHNGQLQKVLTVIGKFYSSSICTCSNRVILGILHTLSYTFEELEWNSEIVLSNSSVMMCLLEELLELVTRITSFTPWAISADALSIPYDMVAIKNSSDAVRSAEQVVMVGCWLVIEQVNPLLRTIIRRISLPRGSQSDITNADFRYNNKDAAHIISAPKPILDLIQLLTIQNYFLQILLKLKHNDAIDWKEQLMNKKVVTWQTVGDPLSNAGYSSSTAWLLSDMDRYFCMLLSYVKFGFMSHFLAYLHWDASYKTYKRKEVSYLLGICLVWVRKVTDFLHKMATDIRICYLLMRIMKLIVVELYYTHTAACIFYYLTTVMPTSMEDNTWIASFRHLQLRFPSFP